MSDILHPCIYEDKDCSLYLELSEERAFFHCYIHTWNKGIVSKFDIIFMYILGILKDKGLDYLYAAILPTDNKLRKFAEMFGFEKTEELVTDNKDSIRELYRCST